MYFVVQDTWEIKNPILKSLHAEPGSHLSPCVEVGLNQPLWHLDLEFHGEEGLTYWRRLIFSSVEQVATTVEAHRGSCRLRLQSAQRVDIDTAYELWQVQTLQTARDRRKRLFHVVKLHHCRLVYPDCNIQDSELTEHRLLYDARR